MNGTIFYADKKILDKIKSDFELIEDKGWYLLYLDKKDKGYWRLNKWDKFQEQYFIKLDSTDNWDTFDSKELEIQLLKETRGTDDKTCIWTGCQRPNLMGLVYCERHAFEEMGIRR